MSKETDYLLPVTKVASASYTLKAGNSSNEQKNITNSSYLQTYSAGEDANRLAAAAKEMGLTSPRRASVQVRRFGASFREQLVHSVLPVMAFEEKRERGFLDTLAGVAGNVLEWYDFAVFGYFGDVIGDVFFPKQEGNAATMEAFILFGGAFLMRPVGGVLLGYMGDVYGRRQALVVSIFLMAFPTFAMGCLPSYEQIGYMSTFLLVLTRLLQGMSVGGQLMSSLVFTLENVPKEQWGLYGSFVWATGNFGVLLGGLVGTFLRQSLTNEQLAAYGWRIPFLSGIIVSVAGFYLNSSEDGSDDDGTASVSSKSLDEECSKGGAEHAPKAKPNPLVAAFEKKNLRPLMASAMVPMMWSAGFYLSFVWMAIYMANLCEEPIPEAFAVNSAALFCGVCVLFPIAGWLSDKYGRRLIMSIGGISLALFSPFLIRSIGQGNPWISFASQLFLGVCLSFWGSPMGAWMVESFDPEARLTSVSVGYNVAHAIVGGSTPALATYMVDAVGPASPGWIYVIVACVSMAGLWLVAPPLSTSPPSSPKASI